MPSPSEVARHFEEDDYENNRGLEEAHLATLVRVIDGDTFWLTVHFRWEPWPGIRQSLDLTYPIRLYRWDTPERGQANYREAIDAVKELLGGGWPVLCGHPVAMSFNRYVCNVWVDLPEGRRLLGEILEERGLAVPLATHQMRLEPLPEEE